MKSEYKKPLENLKDNSADLNDVKGGKRFNLKTEFPKGHNDRNTESKYSESDSNYLTANSRTQNARDDYQQSSDKGSRSAE